MPLQCNSNAVITCIHGGTFKINPVTAPTVNVGGAPAITVADVAPGSVPVTPCPFQPPCTKLAAATAGFSATKQVGGSFVLLQTTQFTTVPAGTATVTSPGQTSVSSS